MPESRPGETHSPHIGGSFAQPSVSAAALPGGDLLDKSLNWSGRKFEKNPAISDDRHLIIQEVDDLVGKNMLPFWAAGNFRALSTEGQRVRAADLLRFFAELKE